MVDIPYSLTDEALGRTIALGQEMDVFLRRRRKLKALDPKAEVKPHRKLLRLMDEIRAEKPASRPRMGSKRDA